MMLTENLPLLLLGLAVILLGGVAVVLAQRARERRNRPVNPIREVVKREWSRYEI